MTLSSGRQEVTVTALIVPDNGGESYVVFGKTSGTTVELAIIAAGHRRFCDQRD